MSTESQREALLTELHAHERQYAKDRQAQEWDAAQAAAMRMMNLCRRLELFKLQEKQEAK